MEHVMIDLETLGRRAGCSILSIGAVAFDTTGLGPEFYTVVDRASCQAHGLHEDENTVAWWNKQSVQAQTVLEQAATNGQPLADALTELTTFLGGLGSLKKLKVWGNGADFDNAILTACYAAVGRELPWDQELATSGQAGSPRYLPQCAGRRQVAGHTCRSTAGVATWLMKWTTNWNGPSRWKRPI
jgi:hypothetical protein